MLMLHVILAVVAVGSLALAPRSAAAAGLIATVAAADVALGTSVAPALRVVVPLIVFLAAALTLARLAESVGLACRVADVLAVRAKGNARALFALVCMLAAVLTATVSLDGAIVLMVPVLGALADRFGAPFAPLLVGSVVVVNASSIAVPQGNPTNLILLGRLGVTPDAFLAHMVLPGILATAAAALVVAVCERQALRAPLVRAPVTREPLSGAERHAAIALLGAALATFASLAAGIPPWWPFAGVAATALVTRPERRAVAVVPWRVAVQVTGLLVVSAPIAPQLGGVGVLGLPQLAALTLGLGACCAMANNLPVGAWVAGMVTSAPTGYAAAIGLGVGSLATPQGSVATMIARDLAGDREPRLGARELAAPACAGVVVAALLLYLSL